MRKLLLTLLFAAPFAFAGGLHDMIAPGTTDYSVEIKIIDSGDGTPETAVEHNTSGIDLWCRREGAAVTSLTEAALAALTTAHTDGGIEHISHGEYRLDLPDSCAAAGVDYFNFGGTVTGMIVIGGRVNLTIENSGDIADAIRTEPCGSETADTFGDLICNDIESIATGSVTVSADIDAVNGVSASAALLNNMIDGIVIASGTCDSGSTSTCVDATLTEADDIWSQGVGIVFTSGSADDQASCVYDFTASSDTITFWAITTAVTTENYVLIADPMCHLADDEGS